MPMQPGANSFRLSKPATVILAVVLVPLLGWFDYATGPELAVSVFYLVPVSIAAWRGGLGAGLCVSVLSGIAWFMAEYAWHLRYSSPFIPYWNALVRLSFFTLTVFLINNIRRLAASLETQAAHLRTEMAERRQAQEKLAESERIFRLITENASDFIAVLNVEGQRIYASPSYAHLLANSDTLHRGDFPAEVIPEDQGRIRAVFQAVVKTGANQRAEYRVATASGATRFLESEWSLMREKDGSARNVVVVSRDVTARKRMELLYASEKDILELIAQGSPLREVLQKLISKVEPEGICCAILVRGADASAAYIENSEILIDPGAGAAAKAEDQWQACHDRAAAAGLHLVHDRTINSTLGEDLGALRIYTRAGEGSEPVRLDLYEKVAHVAAIALERQRSEETLRRLSSLILNAQEAERRRLARDLHDSVSQMLASVAFRIESVLAHVPPEVARVRQEVSKARLLLRKAIHEVHSISENLRPSELDELGLAAALRELCDDFGERNLLEVELNLPAEADRLPTEVELALYRIVQEGLTNVEKHAEATHVSLTLQRDPNFATLQLRDDGKGLPRGAPSQPGKRPGLGLIDMRERCAFLGGSFSIRSEPLSGTELVARIPLKRVNLVK
jgi:PAS domain S-box-containing protein